MSKEQESVSTQDTFTPEMELLYRCRSVLKDKILRPERVFRDHTKECKHVKDMLKRTIKMGESNSLLIIGTRGCGKTTLMTSVLDRLRSSPKFEERAVVVELNGLIHTDDRLALKDMTRQMDLESVVEGKVFGSFSENLSFLLDCLKSGDRNCSKSTIVILEEFDLFCSHHKQTLLYNLFDVTQSAQAPMCVIGLTCRLDVTELLEKRVKSRFSHRQIFLLSPIVGGLDVRLRLFYRLLSLPTDEQPCAEREEYEEIDPVFAHCWNEQIEALARNPMVIDVVRSLYFMDVSERTFKSFLLMVVSRLTAKHLSLEVDDFVHVQQRFLGDAKVAVLKGLSVLEMCLIIAMKHHCEIYDNDPFNFEIILRAYLKFVNQNSSVNVTERSIILKAFEHIKNLELVLPVQQSTGRVQKEYEMHHFLLTSEQVNCAVRQYQNLPTEVAQWAASSLQ